MENELAHREHLTFRAKEQYVEYNSDLVNALHKLNVNLPIGKFFLYGSNGRRLEAASRGQDFSLAVKQPFNTRDLDIGVEEGIISWTELCKLCSEVYQTSNQLMMIDPHLYQVDRSDVNHPKIVFEDWGINLITPLKLPLEWFQPIDYKYYGEATHTLPLDAQFLISVLALRRSSIRAKDLKNIFMLYKQLQENDESTSEVVDFAMHRIYDYLIPPDNQKMIEDMRKAARSKVTELPFYALAKQIVGRPATEQQLTLNFRNAEPVYIDRCITPKPTQ